MLVDCWSHFLKLGRYQLIMLLFIVFMGGQTQAQNHFYIANVFVSDSATNFPVKRANIYVSQLDKIVQTDKLGNCRLGLPPNTYFVMIDHPDYHIKQMLITIKKDTLLQIALKPRLQSYMIGDVKVQAEYFNQSREVVSGLEKMNLRQIYEVPALSGEKDLVKALQIKPGVSGGSEGSAYLFVRGGTPDQNLYLLDGNTIYKSGHLFGFLSAINPINIKQVNFYKGGFPARYGGKLSSVVDVQIQAPNADSLTGAVEVSTLTLKGLIHVPLVKNKLALSLGARTTVYDKFIEVFNNPDGESTNTGFYDANAKLRYTPNKKSTFGLNAYIDKEYFYSQGATIPNTKDRTEFQWRNKFVNANWDYKINDSLHITMQTGATSSLLTFENIREEIKVEDNYKNTFISEIQEFPALIQLNGIGKRFNYQIGAEYKYYKVHPSALKFQYYDTTYHIDNVPQSTYQSLGLFAQGDFTFNKHFKLQAGLRKNWAWNNQSVWDNWEPRLNFQSLFGIGNTLKLSYARMSQPLHLLTNFGLGMPIEVYLPFSEQFVPAQANHYSIMYAKDFSMDNTPFVFSTSLYYKQMDNIIAYKPGYSSADMVYSMTGQSINPNEVITSGNGESMGWEVMLEKPLGQLNGALAFTLSKTMQQFDLINGGEPFYANHHRPVNLNLMLNYNFNPRHRLSVNFNYMTGGRFTMPAYIYDVSDFEFSDDEIPVDNYQRFMMYANGDINVHKMKDFCTLNLAYTIKFNKPRLKSELEFSVYNALNRKNRYRIQFHTGFNNLTSLIIGITSIII